MSFTTAQVAKMLGKSKSAIQRYVLIGLLTVESKNCKLRFTEESVAKFKDPRPNPYIRPMATCCPNEIMYAKSKCYRCYMRELMQNRKFVFGKTKK